MVRGDLYDLNNIHPRLAVIDPKANLSVFLGSQGN
jgi:hypothetical protein